VQSTQCSARPSHSLRLGLHLHQFAIQAALSAGSGIAMHGARAGNLVERTTRLAEFRLSRRDIVIMNSREKRLDLVLDGALATEIERVLLDVLTHAFLGGI
jgi:hypothetical protein